MLTLKGSILGTAMFFVGAFLILCLKYAQVVRMMRRTHPTGNFAVGMDVITMWHNQAIWRIPFFWIALIVFMTIGSWLVRMFSTH